MNYAESRLRKGRKSRKKRAGATSARHNSAGGINTENIDTNSPMGRAFFTVIAAIAQLERDLIVERVKNGLKNARAKGKRIGRQKTRPSEMIRAMLKKGLPQRTIASICGTSNGSISLEKKIMLQEELEAKRAKQKEEAVLQQSGGLHVLDESMPW